MRYLLLDYYRQGKLWGCFLFRRIYFFWERLKFYVAFSDICVKMKKMKRNRIMNVVSISRIQNTSRAICAAAAAAAGWPAVLEGTQ